MGTDSLERGSEGGGKKVDLALFRLVAFRAFAWSERGAGGGMLPASPTYSHGQLQGEGGGGDWQGRREAARGGGWYQGGEEDLK